MDYSTYAAAYAAGKAIGTFFAGCLLGLIPLIVGIVKKRDGTGVTLMLICGALGWVSPLLSLLTAVIGGIVLGCMKANKPEEQQEPEEQPEPMVQVKPEIPKIQSPEKKGWICPKCGLLHDLNMEDCFHCHTPKSQATKFI